jgi:hypothetical protein
MNERDLGWCAGLFEGEGCFTGKIKPSGLRHPVATIKMTDEDVVRRFHKLIGVGSVRGPYTNGDHHLLWAWQVASRVGVAHVIDTLLPFLSERRTSRAQEIRQLC